MFVGVAGAVAAGVAAAMYSQRHRISDGSGRLSLHLEFVGYLARTVERLRENTHALASFGLQIRHRFIGQPFQTVNV